jgi:hypothetical protein
MNISDAIYEYLRTEIIPMIAGESELTAGLLNGALRVGRKKISLKFKDNSILKSFGLVDESGNIDKENVKEFFDGVFDGKEKYNVSLAEILKTATGISSDSELLQGELKFSREDAEKFLLLLSK